MYEPLYDDKHRMIFVTEEEGRPNREKPLQRGIREKLLCSACEGEINRQYEQPNVRVWRGFVEQRPVRGISVTRVRGDDGSWTLHVGGFDYARFTRAAHPLGCVVETAVRAYPAWQPGRGAGQLPRPIGG